MMLTCVCWQDGEEDDDDDDEESDEEESDVFYLCLLDQYPNSSVLESSTSGSCVYMISTSSPTSSPTPSPTQSPTRSPTPQPTPTPTLVPTPPPTMMGRRRRAPACEPFFPLKMTVWVLMKSSGGCE